MVSVRIRADTSERNSDWRWKQSFDMGGQQSRHSRLRSSAARLAIKSADLSPKNLRRRFPVPSTESRVAPTERAHPQSSAVPLRRAGAAPLLDNASREHGSLPRPATSACPPRNRSISRPTPFKKHKICISLGPFCAGAWPHTRLDELVRFRRIGRAVGHGELSWFLHGTRKMAAVRNGVSAAIRRVCANGA